MSGDLPSWAGPAAVAFAAGIGGGLLLARLLKKDAAAEDTGFAPDKISSAHDEIRGVSLGNEVYCTRAQEAGVRRVAVRGWGVAATASFTLAAFLSSTPVSVLPPPPRSAALHSLFNTPHSHPTTHTHTHTHTPSASPPDGSRV